MNQSDSKILFEVEMYTFIQKGCIKSVKYYLCYIMTRFLNKLLFVFTKDALNWSKATVKHFTVH